MINNSDYYTYYCLSACIRCLENDGGVYKRGLKQAKEGGVDVRIVPLTTTEYLNEYNNQVKPYRTTQGLPVWFNGKEKKELFDGKQEKAVQRSRVLRKHQQEAKE